MYNLYDALLNFFGWLDVNIFTQINNALESIDWLKSFMSDLNSLIARLLALFNGNVQEINIINNNNIAVVMTLIIFIWALSLLVKLFKSIISTIASWVSGDTIIITDVKNRRRKKKK